MDEEKFSYSKLDTYVQCPFKYKLNYVDKLSFYSDSLATVLGTAIHKCEEDIARAIQSGQEINYTELKNNLILKQAELEYRFKKDYDERDKSNRLVSEKLYSYLTKEIYNLEKFMNEHPTYEIVGIEQPFNIKYNGKLFNGFIDRVFHDKATDTYLIQDIKTYAVEVENSKLVTPLQFVIYTLAAKELYNCNEDQIFCQYYLPFCDATQNAGTNGYVVRGTKKIDEIFDGILNEDFTPHSSPLCAWCCYSKTNPDAPEEAKYLCPYHSVWDRETREKHDCCRSEVRWQGLENHEKIMESYNPSSKKEVN